MGRKSRQKHARQMVKDVAPLDQLFELVNAEWKSVQTCERWLPSDSTTDHGLRHVADLRALIMSAEANELQQSVADIFNYYLGPVDGGVNIHDLYLLTGWATNSRRVYVVDEATQILLAATSFGGMTWKDLRLPLPFIAVRLATPIKGDAGQSFDTILFGSGKIEGQPTRQFYFSLIKADIATDVLYVQNELAQLRTCLTTGAWVQRQLAQQKSREQLPNRLGRQQLILNVRPDALIEGIISQRSIGILSDTEADDDDISVTVQETADFVNLVLRIALGVPLYLMSLPPHEFKQGCVRRSLQRASIKDQTTITDGAELFSVSSSFEISERDRDSLAELARTGHISTELRAHFRAGHWRRPPGSGADPNAPKTVHVRPTIVRRDRLPDGSLPGGSETNL